MPLLKLKVTGLAIYMFKSKIKNLIFGLLVLAGAFPIFAPRVFAQVSTNFWRYLNGSLSTNVNNVRVGVNTSTPIATLAVKGLAGNINLFEVTSSTGATLFSISPAGTTTVNNLKITGSCIGCGSGVTSVDMSVPTGLSISGNPITTSGTLALSLQSGYVIPKSASTTEWTNLYNNLYTKLTISTSSSGSTFYVSTGSPGTLLINYPANTLSTTTAAATYEPILTKGNLTATSPLQFDNTRQVIGGAAAISVAAGYSIPLTASTTEWANARNTVNASSTNWDTAYTLRHAAVTLAGENYLSLSGQQITANAITLSGTNVTGVLPISKGGTGTSTIGSDDTMLLSNGTLYQFAALPACDSSTQKLIYATSTNSFICAGDAGAGGGISSLNLQTGSSQTFATSTTATGLTQTITSASNIHTWNLSLTSGYVIPLSASTTEWATAYGWGNHAAAGYLTSASASSSYVTFNYASSTFPSYSYGTSTYATIANYPTYTYASGTFVSFAYATNTFATISSYPTYSYASSSYFTKFNVVAGSNIVITTSTLQTITVTSTPTFTKITTTNASTTGLTADSIYFSDSGLLSQNCLGTSSNGKIQIGSCGSALSGGTNGYVTRWTSTSAVSTGILLDNGTVAGINATSSIVTFNVQGAGSNAAFNVASSTGTSLFQITATAQVLVCTTCRLTIPQGTNPTLSAAGDIAQDTTADQLLYGLQPNVLQATSTKSITWESPTASDNITFWRTDVPITITKASCVQTSSVNAPSTTINIRHYTDRSTTTGNTLLASNVACTSTTTAQSLTLDGDSTIAAGEWVWVITSATSNSSSTNITLEFKYDRQ